MNCCIHSRPTVHMTQAVLGRTCSESDDRGLLSKLHVNSTLMVDIR